MLKLLNLKIKKIILFLFIKVIFIANLGAMEIQGSFISNKGDKKIVSVCDNSKNDYKIEFLDFKKIFLENNFFGSGKAKAIGCFAAGFCFVSLFKKLAGKRINFKKRSCLKFLQLLTVGASAITLFWPTYADVDWAVQPDFKKLPEINIKRLSEELVNDNDLEVESENGRQCPCCLSKKDEGSFYTMSCCKNKGFCRHCLNKQIKSDLTHEGGNAWINGGLKCPFCKKSICKKDIDSLVEKSLAEYIEENKKSVDFNNGRKDSNYRHCPTPDCDGYFLIKKDDNGKNIIGRVICPMCKKGYCNDCLIDHLSDKTCQKAKDEAKKLEAEKIKWSDALKKCRDDKAKNCPKCKIKIEKTIGCMHMTCKNCNFEFCWNCLGHDNSKGQNGGYPHINKGDGDFYHCPVKNTNH